MTERLIVTSPLVILKTTTGAYVHVYKGAPVPLEADPAHVADLKASGMVGAVEDDPPAAPEAVEDETVPTRGSSKKDWVAFATAEDRGADRLTEDDAEKLTRDELAEKYLGAKEDS